MGDRLATTEEAHIPAVEQPVGPDPHAQSRLYRWGVTVAHRRRIVLAACLLVLFLCAAAYPSLQSALGPPSFQVKGSDSARETEVLERRFPDLGKEDDVLVFHSSRLTANERGYAGMIAAVDQALARQPGVRKVVGPYNSEAVGQIAEGEHTAVAVVVLNGTPKQRFDRVDSMQNLVARMAARIGVKAWLTGYSPIAKDLGEVQAADIKRAESIGLPLAMIVLVLAMGALVAATLPLLLAFSGLLLADGVLAALALLFRFDSLLLAITTMIGLGIGIDYSLFIVSRFREELARPSVPERDERGHVAHAVGVALATSGRTIVFSGAIVALSLASLFVMDSVTAHEIAVGAIVVVVCMLTAALTFLPAVLALLGHRVDRGALPARMRPAHMRPAGATRGAGGWARWALLIMRRPVPAAALVAVLLLLAAAPVLHMRFGINVGVLRIDSTPSGQGQRALTNAFAPGVMGAVQVLVVPREGQRHGDSVAAAVQSLTQELEKDSRVAAVVEHQEKAGVVLAVVGSVPIDTLTAEALVRHIRSDLAPPIGAHGGPEVLVGGTTAQILDISSEYRAKFPLLLALILLPSLLFLLLAFRSVVLPIKAVLLNLLATGAALGLVVWVFQDGHGHGLFDFSSPGFIQTSLPTTLCALLFGLSMDYEVFLIRRIQEEWHRTHDNKLAIAAGLEHTARTITAAAAIMVAVFGCFLTTNILELKQIGFALAVAIALDATLIRLVLAPALMRLFGDWNWWLPAWLERLLPNLGVD